MFRNEFTKATTLEELKAIYKKLAMKNHPDRGGDTETMKVINNLYDEFFEILKNTHKTKDGKTYTKTTNETPDEFKNIINELFKMQGITIEVIGCFIWVSGNTKPNKEALKALGFKWHSKKACWYKAPKGYRKASNKQYTMDEVRSMFHTRYRAETGESESTTYAPAAV